MIAKPLLLKFHFFIGLIFSFIPFFGVSQLYTFREYNHKDGLKISTTLSTFQDDDNNLLVGTDGNGIVKFDGSTFTDYSPKGIDHPIHVTGYTKIGKISYISTLYSGVLKYKTDTKDTLFMPKLEGNGMFYSVYGFKNKLIAVAQNALLVLDEHGMLIMKHKFPSECTFIQLLKTKLGAIVFTSKSAYLVTDNEVFQLSQWLNNPRVSFNFGSISYDQLKLYDVKRNIVVEYKITDSSTKPIFVSSRNLRGEKVDASLITKASSNGNRILFNADRNTLYEIVSNNSIKKIQHNYSGDLGIVFNVFVDNAKDYWVNTSFGLTKISLEPFTKIELNPVFLNYNTVTSSIDYSGNYNFSTSNSGFVLGNYLTNQLKEYPNNFAYYTLNFPYGTLICCADGLYEIKNKELKKSAILPNIDGKIIFALWENGNIWLSTRNHGLIRYEYHSKKWSTVVSPANYNIIYCGELSKDRKTIYFGTNNGIIKFDVKTLKSNKVNEFNHLGFFCGNSTKDVHGTMWFTLDKGLAGVKKDGTYTTIEDKKFLPTILLYTLTSDQLGNLIVGTNLGIQILKVNENGKVLSSNNYSYNNGFQGFETNMRSASQSGNLTMVGTTQGIYFINTKVLADYPTPPKPVVKRGRYLKNGVFSKDEGRYLSFETALPKVKGIRYFYRIKSLSNKWVELLGTNEYHLPDIENGEYSIEVKSTYNGISFSKITNYQLHINNSVWKSKWFVLFVILFIAILNFGYIEWSKSETTVNYHETNQSYIDYHFVPKLFVFGAIINLLLGLITYYFIDKNLGGLEAYIITSIVLFGLRWVLYFFGRGKKEVVINTSFYLAISCLYLQFFYLMYESKIHPYSLLAVILISGTLPYLIQNIKTILLFSSAQVLLSFTILLFIEQPKYNEVLFIMAVSTSAGLTIMITYLRNNSLKKMYFVNNILNKGSMLVVSFDQKGIINFCSQNIVEHFFVNADQLIGKPLGNLNPLVATTEMREMSIGLEFEDGKSFLVPMYDRKGEITWIEWTCKYISNAARVILGQDVSEKIKLTTNYESLVENANDLIYITDIDTNFTYLNEMSYKVFGFRKESLIGKSSIFIVHPDYREKVKSFYENQFKNRIQNTYLEFPIKAKDGKVIWLGQNVSLIHEPGMKKRISGFSALARDITEKRMNELLIEQQNKDITSSINSAKRIQYGLIPKAVQFNHYFEDNFVVFKPKDIVSGDFYWIHEQEGKLIVVVADSTGYGVPGAFMTILGISLLNQIVKERKITDAAGILNALNSELQTVIQQHSAMTVIDDMEALISVYENDTLQFASSGVILIHNHGKELDLYRRTKIDETDPNSLYHDIKIKVSDDDVIYLLTDGYQKQVGSLKNKKFSLKNVLELLKKIHVELLPLQRKHIENTYTDWSEGHEQTDDIIFIGLKKFKKK